MQAGEREDKDKFSVWFEFDKHAAASKPQGTATSRAIIEVQRYLESPVIPRHDDPMKWWVKDRYLYPYLAFMAQERLSALCTSVPCERIFSKAGLIISGRRSRLSASKVEKLIFLSVNAAHL